MNIDFFSIPHDTIIKDIRVDRSKPGYEDIIKIKLQIEKKPYDLVFFNVYEAILELNFGIIADETIRDVDIINDSILENIKKKWKKLNLNLDNLKCYYINTNSTNSKIRIYALEYKIEAG